MVKTEIIFDFTPLNFTYLQTLQVCVGRLVSTFEAIILGANIIRNLG
jgi:hypothetical protein